jgi:prephenate dehydrogenase
MRIKHCDVGIAGLGLIGSSMAAKLSGGGHCRSVIGWDVDPGVSQKALEKGFVIESKESLQDLASSSEVLVLALPPSAIVDTGREALRGSRGKVRVIMDTGSAKRKVAKGLAMEWNERYVGLHPMAGKELGGIENADPALFEGSVTAVVATSETSTEARETAREMAEALGSRVVETDPETHDRMVACVSHLPIFMAMALALTAGECGRECPKLKDLAAGGFKDTSRVASGPSWLVSEIWEQNSDFIAPLIHKAATFLEMMADSSGKQLAEISKRASSARNSILEGRFASLGGDHS